MIQVTSSVLSALNVGVSSILFPREIPILRFTGQLTANGSSSVELSPLLQLPRNAVVASYKVTVRAGRADWAIGKSVGQLRQQGASVVVDFGVLRTVAGVGVVDASKFQIVRVRPWTGTAFADPVVGSAKSSTPQSGAAVLFPSQIRTERLQIDLASTADVSAALLLQLPDLPADLELRINGAAPVWTAPGPVIAGSPGWLADAASGLAYRQVDLAAALNALLADPTADITSEVDLHVVLSARVPGALGLEPPDNASLGLRYLAQVALPAGAKQVRFAEEGLQAVPLHPPDWAQSVEEVKLTLAAKLPPERTLPPLGPDLQPVAAGSAVPLAEMALDPERAAAVALPSLDALGELVAVRLPLRAEAAGAEVRVLLLAGDGGQPGDPLPGAVSKPVELAAAGPASPADMDVWSTFAFPRPIPLHAGDPAKPRFLAILVTRGRVRWAFTGEAAAGEVRFGPPDGPWQPLPGLGQLSDLRGRVRLQGHALSGQPIAPLELGLVGGAARIPATPTPKGVTVELAGPVAATGAALQVVSLTAGTVTLRDVVVTVTRKS
ncbi:MAG TPA: hypothetical protein VFE33_26775 [Thermoanaerobaculia bacterium]|nr:hypothetical protein [Thermoanaerobaculia bacterium]